MPPLRFHSCAAKNDRRFNQPLPFISEAKHTTLMSSQGSPSETSSRARELVARLNAFFYAPQAQKQEEFNNQHKELQKDLVSKKSAKGHFIRDQTLG